MRLRTLTEAECYARCYGGHGSEQVTVVRVLRDPGGVVARGERMRELFEQRLDARGFDDHEPEAEAA
jgi:hypothetical protein